MILGIRGDQIFRIEIANLCFCAIKSIETLEILNNNNIIISNAILVGIITQLKPHDYGELPLNEKLQKNLQKKNWTFDRQTQPPGQKSQTSLRW